MNPEFDKKLGADFIGSLPECSGVYLFTGALDQIVYVGKAKNIKKRLSQYRLASAKKPDRKMRLIVKRSSGLRFQVCANEQEALLLENQLIQTHRPALNIAGAFFFMYPYLALKWDPQQPRDLVLAYTSSPDDLGSLGFKLFGAFRSRQTVGEAYDALRYLLSFLGHPTPSARKSFGKLPYSRLTVFRQLDEAWIQGLHRLMAGGDGHFIGDLALYLLEKPSARQGAATVQEHLKSLKHFFQEEAVGLQNVRDALQLDDRPIPQSDRDRIFLEWRSLQNTVNR